MTTLGDLAALIRSKNAGPFVLTFDIMFEDEDTYRRVRDAKVLTPEVLSRIYGVEASRITVYAIDPALSLKASMPRPEIQGSLRDTDVHGGQQFVPLLDIEVP